MVNIGPLTTDPPFTLDDAPAGGSVALRKGQAVSLVKSGAPPLTLVRCALGWEPAVRGDEVDLDASVIAFGERRALFGRSSLSEKAVVFFGRTSAFDGAIAHSGDNLTGAGDGDDEVITVNLAALPDDVSALVVTVNSYRGHKFTAVTGAYCRLLDAVTGAELARYNLSERADSTGLLMATLTRASAGGSWTLRAVGQFAAGRRATDVVGAAAALLGGGS